MTDGMTTIGFCDDYAYGYCRVCENIFTYHWNGYNPLSQDKTCPNCGNYDKVVSSNGIENRISLIRDLVHSDITDDNEKIKLRQHISDLNKIRRKFDEYERKN